MFVEDFSETESKTFAITISNNRHFIQCFVKVSPKSRTRMI